MKTEWGSLPKTHRATRQPPEVIQSHFGTIRTASVLPQETTVRSANGQTARSAFSGERSQAGFDFTAGDVVQLVRTLSCRWLESRTITANSLTCSTKRTRNPHIPAVEAG